MTAEYRGDARIQTLVDVVRADVHGKRYRAARSMPFGALGDGAIERPASDAPNEAGLFGERYESGGTQQAAGRMLPAHQHFGTGHTSRRQFDLGLEIKTQLVLLDGASQLPEKRELFSRR